MESKLFEKPGDSPSTDAAWNGDRDPHPLLNPLILDTLFDHCSPPAWKQMRLVCKTWYEELLPRWREEMIVYLQDVTDFSVSRDQTPPKKRVRMIAKDYLSVDKPNGFYQLDSKPFRSLHCVKSRSPIEIGLNSIQIAFWKSCGPSLKRLHLYRASIAEIEALNKLVFEWTPNLAELRYTHCKIMKSTTVEKNDKLEEYTPPNQLQTRLKILSAVVHENGKYNFPLNWMRFLSTFPNIQELGLAQFSPENVSHIIKTIGVIRKAKNSSVLNLTDFYQTGCQVSPFVEEEVLTAFSQLAPSLRNLFCIVTGMTPDDVKKLLVPVRRTLEVLTLEETQPFCMVDLPVSPKVLPTSLTILNLRGFVVASWAFLGYLPNLKKLSVCTDRSLISCCALREGSIRPCVHLHSFKYNNADVMEVAILQLLLKVMPNLKTLGLPLETVGLELVCKTWPKLENLDLLACNIVEREVAVNISKLTELKTLTVLPGEVGIGIDLGSFNAFGETLIYEGILKLPKLKQVRVHLRRNISSDAIEKLKEKLGDANVLILY